MLSGNALELQFEKQSLDGIQALRMLHFLRPFEVRVFFENAAKWLKSGGLLCVTVGTPYIAVAVGTVRPEYERKKANNEEWPGEITEEMAAICWPEGISCKQGYLFDKETLERETIRAGLRIIRCEYLAREFAFTNGKENLGLLAEKL